MARMWLAAAVVGLAVSAGRADFGGPLVPTGPSGPPEGYGMPPVAHDKYGAHPFLKKLFSWKKDEGVGHFGAPGGSHAYSPYPFGAGATYSGPPGVGYPGTPGPQMPGTLVFPNHQFNRSPRDYFMYEAGR